MIGSGGENTIVVLAAGAHPDDVELVMAGTLLMLGDRGASLHVWSLTDGRFGSIGADPEQTARARSEEARLSAGLAGAALHPPLFPDLGLFYHPDNVRKIASVVRSVRPDVMLVPSPCDYCEDHSEASRLLVTAAFARAIPSFPVDPPEQPWDSPVAVYHATPYGLRDGTGSLVLPGFYIDISAVMERKKEMIACHRSQMEWMSDSQGTVPADAMEAMSRELGRASGRFLHAEGWTMHNPLGLGPPAYDPVRRLLVDGCC